MTKEVNHKYYIQNIIFSFIIIDTRFSNDNSELTLSEQIFDSKIWRKDQSLHKKDDSIGNVKNKNDTNKNKESNTNNLNENNFSLNENFFNQNTYIYEKNNYGQKEFTENSRKLFTFDQKEKISNTQKVNNDVQSNIYNSNNKQDNLSSSMASLGISSLNKKLPFSLQSKPFNLNKKINTNENNKYMNNNFSGNNYNIHNISKLPLSKKDKDLFSKIKEKVTKENLSPKNIKKIKESDKKLEKNISEPSSKSSNSNTNDDQILDNKIDENPDKKDSNDDEDDILSEQKDEMEEGDNKFLNINKVDSIKIHSNFIPGHNYTGSGFSHNSNTSSNKSSINKKCNTEPNNPQLYMNDCPSGRSNNSGNQFVQGRFGYGGGGYDNFYPGRVYNPHSNYGYPFKSSFLSTNTNSHNQSGQRFDSSYSSESGQSPHFLGNMQSARYNNPYQNNNTLPNNNYIFPFVSSVTPIGNRHVYTSSFNSNESLFSRQPFSVNTSSPYNKPEYKYGNNNYGTKKENQVINLEEVALGKENRTTVMIRNIPIKYDTTILEKELEPFEGKYDCLYMPYDYDNEGNKGYAFLNLTNPYHVLLFYEYFNNRDCLYFESKKICGLNYANFQGIEEIKKHAKNYKGKKKPVFFICTKDDHTNNIIEIPMKYLSSVMKANPKMKYHENKMKNTFIVDSFN